MGNMFEGTYTALVTPFTADGKSICYSSLERLLAFQAEAGVDGVVACGSTGEAVTLSDQEYHDFVSTVRKWCRSRPQGSALSCIAGIGTSSTARAVAQARMLHEIGVDGILLVVPPYNKPTQDGMVAHYREVKQHCALPIIAYNIPGRTGANMLPATVAKLCDQGTIVAIKEATGSLDQMIDLAALTGTRLSILSGEDSLVVPMMAMGGTGVISAAANVIPRLFVEMVRASARSDFETARAAQLKALPVIRALFSETNPIPAKAALAWLGVIESGTVRLPLTAAKAETIARLKTVIEAVKA